MDPITILGAAGAVADIVGVITKTIIFLDELYARWKRVELTVINLKSQLTSLRAALNEISEWIQSDLAFAPQHHQLVLDLEQSISCCRLLVQSMDVFLSELKLTDDSDLDLDQKIRTVFSTKRYNEFQMFISHQTNALNLLLTACSWYACFCFYIESVLPEKEKELMTAAKRHRSRKRCLRNLLVVMFLSEFGTTHPHCSSFMMLNPFTVAQASRQVHRQRCLRSFRSIRY